MPQNYILQPVFKQINLLIRFNQSAEWRERQWNASLITLPLMRVG
jgi:hypothetical protein